MCCSFLLSTTESSRQDQEVPLQFAILSSHPPPLCLQTHQERNRLSPEPAGPCPQRACTFVTPWATSKAPCTSFLPDLASAIQVRRTVALLLTAGALNEPMTNTDGVWSSAPLLGHQDPEPFANSGEINSFFGNTGAT